MSLLFKDKPFMVSKLLYIKRAATVSTDTHAHTLSIDVAAIRGPYWFVMLSESLARTETNEGSSSLKRREKKTNVE